MDGVCSIYIPVEFRLSWEEGVGQWLSTHEKLTHCHRELLTVGLSLSGLSQGLKLCITVRMICIVFRLRTG